MKSRESPVAMMKAHGLQGRARVRSLLERIADRLLSMPGLGLDFSFELRDSVVSEITPTLWLGARPDHEQVRALEGVGVTHVVSCLQEHERAKVEFLGRHFRHLFLDVRDGMHQDIERSFASFFEFAEAAAAGAREARLFVHCEVGVSRSASLVIALLMKREGLRFYEAFRRVRSKRSQVLPNIGFASRLQQLEHELLPPAVDGGPSSLARYLCEVCNAPVEIEVLEAALVRHSYDAVESLRGIFGEDIPRVIQGVRV